VRRQVAGGDFSDQQSRSASSFPRSLAHLSTTRGRVAWHLICCLNPHLPSGRTGMIVKVGLALVLWTGIFALIKLTMIVF
jgi:hypothetical protein